MDRGVGVVVGRFSFGYLHFYLALIGDFSSVPWSVGSPWIAGLSVVIELLLLGGGICRLGELWPVFITIIERNYLKAWIFLHIFVCSFEVLSMAEKLGVEDGGATYCTLYFI